MSRYGSVIKIKTFVESTGQVGNMTLQRLDDGTYELAELVAATNKVADGGFTEQDIDLQVNTGRWKIDFEPLTDEERAAELKRVDEQVQRMQNTMKVMADVVRRFSMELTEVRVSLGKL